MPAKRLNFTKNVVERLAPTTVRYVVHDTRVHGLQVEVQPSGAKTFRLYRKIHGRPERVLIGRWPDVSVEDARGKASALNGQIAKGENPATDARALRQQLTFGELFDLYLERHAKPHKRSWEGDQWLYDKYLAPWASRRLSSIDRSAVERLHVAIGEASGIYAANRTLALISTLFSKALVWGWNGTVNPAKGVQKFREEKRERFLVADELPKFFKALAAEPDTDARDAIVVMLMTGARKANVLAMAWADINLDRQLWVIPLTKSGESQRVPLSPDVVALLARRDAAAKDDAARRAKKTKTDVEAPTFVFPARRGAVTARRANEHRVEVKSAWDRIRAASGLDDVRLHDLRRTLGSWQAAAGVSLPIIGKSLGHKDLSTTQVYARLDLDPVRAAVTAANVALLAAGTATETAPTTT